MSDAMLNKLINIAKGEMDDYFFKMQLSEEADDPWLKEILVRSARDEESHARYLLSYLKGKKIPDDMLKRYNEMERHMWG